MPRADLLALSDDDLATLASRGLVKRALRDLESGQVPTGLHEDPDGTVHATWPDGAVVELRTDAKLDDRCCTCASTGLCRHIIATILHYRQHAPSVEQPDLPAPWNPGEISDAAIQPMYRPAVLEAVRKEWNAGVVIEVHRLAKPLARLHTTGHTVRFLVPFDLRYAQCDCAEDAPCRHVPLAIWGFRALEPERNSALLALNQRSLAGQPHSGEIRKLAAGLCEFGIGELPPTHLRRWEGLAAALRKDRIPWLEEIVSEVLLARDRKLRGDARFAPAELASLVGELLIRASAMENDTGAVPQLFVRGSPKDTAVEIGTARLIGLGSFVDVKRKSVTLNIPLQDTSTGVVVSVQKDSEGDAAFEALAASHFNKQYRYEAIASGQILAKGARRSPNLELMASRAPLVVHPQAFEWEKLRPPVLAEGFAEIVAHQSVLPPASLRPRRMNENLHVCPVDQVADVSFDRSEQRLVAYLQDAAGEKAILQQPYHSRAAGGFARLRQHLGTTRLRFVAGRVRRSHQGLIIEPSGLVFEENGVRWLLQPWTDRGIAEPPPGPPSTATASDPIKCYLGELQLALGDLLTAGLERSDSRMLRSWQDLSDLGTRLGFVRLVEPVRELARELERRPSQLGRSPDLACSLATTILMSARFGMDLAD